MEPMKATTEVGHSFGFEQIPTSVESFKNSHSLLTLYLSDNLLKSSVVFHWFFNFTTNLQSFSLYNNLIEGPIPYEFRKVMNSLEALSLGKNKLKGEIPTSLGNICTLKILYLETRLIRQRKWANQNGDDGSVGVAKGCPNLLELMLIGVNPTKVSLEMLASNCQNLERLALCGSDSVDDPEISCITAKCVTLKKLCIKSCPVLD
ncbi:hypothetical protein V8G54_005830 [Vigna mungo]|uniref:Uncharacterized protein n=1 Tax=Vigna mungo TaxID=3915 RepID=A0AAQ3NZB5_VIGMU